MGSIADIPNQKPFEGAEKLLEIVFHQPEPQAEQISCPDGFDSLDGLQSHPKCISPEELGKGNLRRIKRRDIENILNKVNCTILNECHSEKVTAYLLSESSLFLFDEKLIVKTCGQTNLLNAIDDFVHLGKNVGFDAVAEIFYSRPNFLNPGDQPFWHQKFKRETQILLKHFSSGHARVLGSTNSDCYHLFCYSSTDTYRPGCTLEIIMTELAQDRRRMFYNGDGKTAAAITKQSGFATMFGEKTEVLIDDYLFEPCGYSMNAIIDQEQYCTVHVTPEDCGSYASFETDHCDNAHLLVQKVVSVFQPRRFFVTVISDEDSHESIHSKMAAKQLAAGYERHEYQFSVFSNHYATFARFQRPPAF